MTDPILRVAIYDLDRTVLRKPTFTLFLLWAARREAQKAQGQQQQPLPPIE